jgi:hypothetical protein
MKKNIVNNNFSKWEKQVLEQKKFQHWVEQFYSSLWLSKNQENIWSSEEIGRKLYDQYYPQKYNIQYSNSSTSFIS